MKNFVYSVFVKILSKCLGRIFLFLLMHLCSELAFAWDHCGRNPSNPARNTPQLDCQLLNPPLPALDFSVPTAGSYAYRATYFYCVRLSDGGRWPGYCWNDSVTTCSSGQTFNLNSGQCDSASKNAGTPPLGNCAGNPINVGGGNKFQQEMDYRNNSNTIFLQRAYNSDGLYRPAYFGNGWVGTYDRAVTIVTTNTVSVNRPDGKIYAFTLSNNVWMPDADVSDQLSGNSSTGWTYKGAADESIEIYDASGKLTSITSRSGHIQNLIYSDTSTQISIAPAAGLLIRVINSFGHQLNFTYDAAKRIRTMTDSNGGHYVFSYDIIGNLISVKYPDNKTRTYVYNESANTSGADLPNALTGIIDENGHRFATYKYDAQGRAISSEHNLANGNPVEKVSIAYSTDVNGNVTSSAVTDALNTTRNYSFTTILGVVKNTGVSQPSIRRTPPNLVLLSRYFLM